jgi:hypothetical protein
MKAFYGYMMTNRSRAVLYTGITNSLMLAARKEERIGRDHEREVGGFIADALSAYERSLAPLGMTKENI